MMRILLLGALGPDLDHREISHAREAAWEMVGPFDLLLANASWLLGGAPNPARTFHDLHEQGLDLALIGGPAFGREPVRNLLEEPNIPLVRPFNMHAAVPGLTHFDVPNQTDGPRLRVVSLATLCNRFLVAEPFAALRELLRDLPREITLLIECQGADTAMKQALHWWLSRHASRPIHLLGTGLGVGTTDTTITRGCAMVTDVGIFGRADLLAGMRPEDWWHRFMWRDDHGPPLPCPGLQRDAVFLELDHQGMTTAFRRLTIPGKQ